ncbi:MAG: hypothetical protein WDL87_07435 [Candidatus Omnitrophota bacterium]|jgi:pimeloyl-ACP methyl ester carboxylesterase
MPRKVIRCIAIFLSFCFFFEQSGFAQIAGQLDISGHFAQLRNTLIQDKFRPLHLRYLSYDNLNNNFSLLLDKGDARNLNKPALEDTTKTILNYFFIGISLPNDSFWVNLRPDAEDNIIDPLLAKTDLGKVLLEADLQLKKDTAQFTSPETPEGKEYWDKLYKKAEELLGSDNITIPTLTRPWIVPNEIIIREANDNAYIYKATLKVMLEQDYLKGSAVYNFEDDRLKALNEYASQLIRERIIPKITKDVNTAKRYAPLRQVYYSLIMAQWFKARFYGKGGLYSWMIDKKNLNGLTSQTPWSKTTYFKEYQRSFKDGEYNIKIPVSTPMGQSIRSYFSGGMNLTDFQVPFPGASSFVVSSIVGHSRAGSSPLARFQDKGISFFVEGGTVEHPSVRIELKSDVPVFIDQPASVSQEGNASSSAIAKTPAKQQRSFLQNVGDQIKKFSSIGLFVAMLFSPSQLAHQDLINTQVVRKPVPQALPANNFTGINKAVLQRSAAVVGVVRNKLSKEARTVFRNMVEKGKASNVISQEVMPVHLEIIAGIENIGQVLTATSSQGAKGLMQIREIAFRDLMQFIDELAQKEENDKVNKTNKMTKEERAAYEILKPFKKYGDIYKKYKKDAKQKNPFGATMDKLPAKAHYELGAAIYCFRVQRYVDFLSHKSPHFFNLSRSQRSSIIYNAGPMVVFKKAVPQESFDYYVIASVAEAALKNGQVDQPAQQKSPGPVKAAPVPVKASIKAPVKTSLKAPVKTPPIKPAVKVKKSSSPIADEKTVSLALKNGYVPATVLPKDPWRQTIGDGKKIWIIAQVPGSGKQQNIESLVKGLSLDSSKGFNVIAIEGEENASGSLKLFVAKNEINTAMMVQSEDTAIYYTLRENGKRSLFARELLALMLKDRSFQGSSVLLPLVRVFTLDESSESIIATEYIPGAAAVKSRLLGDQEESQNIAALKNNALLDMYCGLLLYQNDREYLSKDGALIPFDFDTALAPLYYQRDFQDIEHSYNGEGYRLRGNKEAYIQAAEKISAFILSHKEDIQNIIHKKELWPENAQYRDVSLNDKKLLAITPDMVWKFLESGARQMAASIKEWTSQNDLQSWDNRPIADLSFFSSRKSAGSPMSDSADNLGPIIESRMTSPGGTWGEGAVLSAAEQGKVAREAEKVTQFLAKYKPDSINDILAKLSFNFTFADIAKLSIGYLASGANKHAFKVDIVNNDGEVKAFSVALKLPAQNEAMFEEGEEEVLNDLWGTGFVPNLGKVFYLQANSSAPGGYEYSETKFDSGEYLTVLVEEFVDGFTLGQVDTLCGLIAGNKELRNIVQGLLRQERITTGDAAEQVKSTLMKIRTVQLMVAKNAAFLDSLVELLDALLRWDKDYKILSETQPNKNIITETLAKNVSEFLARYFFVLNKQIVLDGRMSLDLHSNNIMLEKETGALRIIDPGKTIPGSLDEFIIEMLFYYGVSASNVEKILPRLMVLLSSEQLKKLQERLYQYQDPRVTNDTVEKLMEEKGSFKKRSKNIADGIRHYFVSGAAEAVTEENQSFGSPVKASSALVAPGQNGISKFLSAAILAVTLLINPVSPLISPVQGQSYGQQTQDAARQYSQSDLKKEWNESSRILDYERARKVWELTLQYVVSPELAEYQGLTLNVQGPNPQGFLDGFKDNILVMTGSRDIIYKGKKLLYVGYVGETGKFTANHDMLRVTSDRKALLVIDENGSLYRIQVTQKRSAGSPISDSAASPLSQASWYQKTAVLLFGTVLLSISTLGCGPLIKQNYPLSVSGRIESPQQSQVSLRDVLSMHIPRVPGLYQVGAFQQDRPTVVFIHGADGSPSYFNKFLSEFEGKFNLAVFSYNYFDKINDVSALLSRQLSLYIGTDRENETVIVAHSYGAKILRDGVLNASGQAAEMFRKTSVIELAATPFGSIKATGASKVLPQIAMGLVALVGFQDQREIARAQDPGNTQMNNRGREARFEDSVNSLLSFAVQDDYHAPRTPEYQEYLQRAFTIALGSEGHGQIVEHEPLIRAIKAMIESGDMNNTRGIIEKELSGVLKSTPIVKNSSSPVDASLEAAEVSLDWQTFGNFLQGVKVTPENFMARWGDYLKGVDQQALDKVLAALKAVKEKLEEKDKKEAYSRDGDVGSAVRYDCWLRNGDVIQWLQEALGKESAVLVNTGKNKGEPGYHAYGLFKLGSQWFTIDAAADQFEPEIERSSEVGLVILPAGRGDLSVSFDGFVSFREPVKENPFGLNNEWAFNPVLLSMGDKSSIYGSIPRLEMVQSLEREVVQKEKAIVAISRLRDLKNEYLEPLFVYDQESWPLKAKYQGEPSKVEQVKSVIDKLEKALARILVGFGDSLDTSDREMLKEDIQSLKDYREVLLQQPFSTGSAVSAKASASPLQNKSPLNPGYLQKLADFHGRFYSGALEILLENSSEAEKEAKILVLIAESGFPAGLRNFYQKAVEKLEVELRKNNAQAEVIQPQELLRMFLVSEGITTDKADAFIAEAQGKISFTRYAGIPVLEIDAGYYKQFSEKVGGVLASSQAVAHLRSKPQEPSFIIKSAGDFKKENIMHELSHIIWFFLERTGSLKNINEQGEELTRGFRRFRDELCSYIVSGDNIMDIPAENLCYSKEKKVLDIVGETSVFAGLCMELAAYKKMPLRQFLYAAIRSANFEEIKNNFIALTPFANFSGQEIVARLFLDCTSNVAKKMAGEIVKKMPVGVSGEVIEEFAQEELKKRNHPSLREAFLSESASFAAQVFGYNLRQRSSGSPLQNKAEEGSRSELALSKLVVVNGSPSFSNKQQETPQIVIPGFGQGYDGADLQFILFGNLFYEASRVSSVPKNDESLKAKGFRLVDNLAIRPTYIVVNNEREALAVQMLLDLAIKKSNGFVASLVSALALEKDNPYNIINLENKTKFTVLSEDGRDVEVEVVKDGENYKFIERYGNEVKEQEIVSRKRDTNKDEHVHKTGNFTPEQFDRYHNRPAGTVSVTFMGVNDALSEEDVTNFLINIGTESIFVDPSLEAYVNLKAEKLLPSRWILTHNHTDHNAGFVQFIIEQFSESKIEAAQEGQGKNMQYIVRKANGKINTYDLIMTQEVKDDLIEVIAAYLLGGETYEKRTLQEAQGFSRQWARALLQNEKVERGFEKNGKDEIEFIDKGLGVTIVFRNHQSHPIATYGFVVTSNMGNIGYVVDTSSMDDFTWAADKLKTQDPNGENSILISENGFPAGFHLTVDQLQKAVEGSEFLQALGQQRKILLVHSKDNGAVEVGDGDQKKISEWLRRAERFETRSAGSPLAQGNLASSSASEKEKLQKYSPRLEILMADIKSAVSAEDLLQVKIRFDNLKNDIKNNEGDNYDTIIQGLEFRYLVHQDMFNDEIKEKIVNGFVEQSYMKKRFGLADSEILVYKWLKSLLAIYDLRYDTQSKQLRDLNQVYDIAIGIAGAGAFTAAMFDLMGLATTLADVHVNGETRVGRPDFAWRKDSRTGRPINPEELRGKKVILCENDINTGATLDKFLKELSAYEPGQVDIVFDFRGGTFFINKENIVKLQEKYAFFKNVHFMRLDTEISLLGLSEILGVVVDALKRVENLSSDTVAAGSPIISGYISRILRRPVLKEKEEIAALEEIIKENEYQVIGGTRDQEAYRMLRKLMYKGVMARHTAVYSPVFDYGLSLYSAEFIKDKEALPAVIKQLKSQGRDSIRILVIGSGTGVDALTAYAQVKDAGLRIRIDAIDILQEAVENTKFNLNLLFPGSNDAEVFVHKVEKEKEFETVSGKYDFIYFNSPNAVYDSQVKMEGAYQIGVTDYTRLLNGIEDHLSDIGIAIVGNTLESRKFVPPGLRAVELAVHSWDKELSRRIMFKMTKTTSSPIANTENSGFLEGVTPEEEAVVKAKIQDMLSFTRGQFDSSDRIARSSARSFVTVFSGDNLLRAGRLILEEAQNFLKELGITDPGEMRLYMTGGRLKNNGFKGVYDSSFSDIDIAVYVEYHQEVAQIIENYDYSVAPFKLLNSFSLIISKACNLMSEELRARGELREDEIFPAVFEFLHNEWGDFADLKLVEPYMLIGRINASPDNQAPPIFVLSKNQSAGSPLSNIPSLGSLMEEFKEFHSLYHSVEKNGVPGRLGLFEDTQASLSGHQEWLIRWVYGSQEVNLRKADTDENMVKLYQQFLEVALTQGVESVGEMMQEAGGQQRREGQMKGVAEQLKLTPDIVAPDKTQGIGQKPCIASLITCMAVAGYNTQTGEMALAHLAPMAEKTHAYIERVLGPFMNSGDWNAFIIYPANEIAGVLNVTDIEKYLNSTGVKVMEKIPYSENAVDIIVDPQGQAEVRNVLNKELAGSFELKKSGSSVKLLSSSPLKPGGIDLRALPIVTQPMNVPGMNVVPPLSRFENVNLNEEWQQIQDMIQAGIIPASDRIKEYLEACCFKDDINPQVEKVLACIADILRLEEDQLKPTESAFRDFLALLESDKPAGDLQVALTKIAFTAKEPVTIEQ